MADTLNPSAKVEQVITALNERARKFEEAADPREIFTGIYRDITERILTKLLDQRSNQAFDDPLWLAELDSRFAQYYLDALDAFDRHDPKTPRVWQTVFTAIGVGNSTTDSLSSADVLRALVQPMLAHIKHDLVFALADLLKASPGNKAAREADHEKVTRLLCATIDDVQKTRAKFAALLGLLDQIFFSFNEKFTCDLVGQMRQQAWEDAQKLLAAQNEAERAVIIKKVETKTVDAIEIIPTSPLNLITSPLILLSIWDTLVA